MNKKVQVKLEYKFFSQPIGTVRLKRVLTLSNAAIIRFCYD
jgi:hypothetical protein